MDLPPLSNQIAIVNRLTASLSELNLSTLARELVGQQLQALVKQVVELNTQQQQQLLRNLSAQSGAPASGGDNQASNTSQKSAELITLLRQPQLKLITLDVKAAANQTAMPKQIQVLSTLAVQTNQLLQAQVREDGQLKFLEISPAPRGEKAPATPLNTSAPAVTTQAPLPAAHEEIIRTGLRHYVPHEQNLSKTLPVLVKSAEILNTLKPEVRRELISTQLQQNLQPLRTSPTPAASHEITVQSVKQAVQQSGQFFENSVAKNLQPPAPDLVKGAQPATRVDQVEKGDLKAQLLAVFREASQATHVEKPGSTPANLQQYLQTAASQIRNADTLLNALAQLAVAKKTIQQDFTQIQAQLARVLSAASALGLARISANQLRQLLATSRETPANPAPLSLDIAVRVQDALLPVFLHLQPFPPVGEEEPKRKRSDKSKRQQSRLWKIYLEMELETENREATRFAAEISLNNKKVATKLWSEDEKIKERTHSRLNRLRELLESKGLEVEDMQFFATEPPQRKQQVTQSLVDIRT